MKKIHIKIAVALLIALSIPVFIMYFLREDTNNFTDDAGTLDFDSSLIIKPKLEDNNTTEHLKRLDSAIDGKNLSLQSQIRVHDYKRYIFEVFRKDYQKAHSYADSALALMTGKNPKQFKDEYAIVYLGKGDVFFSEEKYNEAFVYYYKAKQLGVNFFDSCIKSDYSYRLAMIYYKQAYYDEAKNNFIAAFNESEYCEAGFDNYYRRQQVLSNTGLSYYQTKKYDSSALYYQKALDFVVSRSKQYPDNVQEIREALGVIYGNLGNVYLKKKEVNAAKSMFKRNVEINLNEGFDIKHAQASCLNLAELYLQENKLDSAFISLQKVKTSIDTVSTPRTEADWNRLMWQYFEKKNNINEAHKYLQHYQIKKDLWLDKQNSIAKVDLSKQYDLFEKQHRVELLETENKLKNTYLFVIVIFSLIVVGFLIYLWINWRATKKFAVKLHKLNKTILSQNNELENALNSQYKSNSEKEKLLKLLAHDLRAPIASLDLMVDLILDEKDEAEKEELLSLMKTTSVSALALIRDALKSNVDETESNPKTPVLINEYIVECCELLEILADEKNIKLVLELPKENSIVPIYPEKLKRVLNNLVINAIKFSPKETTIKVIIESNNDFLEIAIQDQGIGIAENKLDSIFNLKPSEYNRIGTEGEQSYGLGLPFCKEVIEEHKGTIRLESSEGKGSTFFIKLPLKNM